MSSGKNNYSSSPSTDSSSSSSSSSIFSIGTSDGHLVGWTINSPATPSSSSSSTSSSSLTSLGISLAYAFQVSTESVRALAASEHYLLTAAGDTILVYDIYKRKQVGVLSHHADTVLGLEFIGKSSLLSTDYSGYICLWDCKQWTPVLSVRGHKCRITSTAVHPSGRAALTIGFDGTLRLWDLTKGKGVHTLDTKLENILQIRWTPDGENFLITTEKYIHMFTSETCKIIHTWIIPDMNDKITSMEIIPITNESGGKKTKSGKKETNNHSWFLIIGCETGQFLISLWTTIQTFSSSDNTVGISSSTIQSHSFISVNSPYPKRIKQIKLYNSSVIIVLQSNGIVTLMDIQKIYEKDIINRTEQEFTTEDKNDLISSLYTLKDAKDTRPITCALSNI